MLFGDEEAKRGAARNWNDYQIELVYFANKKDKNRWEQEDNLGKRQGAILVEQILTEFPPMEVDDPFSFETLSEVGTESQGGRASVASRYAGAKSKAGRKGSEIAAEFTKLVKTLDTSTPAAQRAYEAEIGKAERRGARAEKAKGAELLQDAKARGRSAAAALRRELAQEQEKRLGLEREVETVKQVSQSSVTEYELLRAELSRAKKESTRLAAALAEASSREAASSGKMQMEVLEDQAGCVDKGAEAVAKLAYEKEKLVEQLVEAQAQADRAEQAQAGLEEERNREEQLMRESENQARGLIEEVQRLQAELARAKAQADSTTLFQVLQGLLSLLWWPLRANNVQPASAGTTTTSDILQHNSTLTTAMDLKEKNGQLAEEAAHWKARTEELEKEIAGVGRGQSKREAGGQSAPPPQGPAAENQPDVLQ
ncbi:hypothetical protein KFL_012780010, partial [Klebsormidium nitens]